MQLVDPVNDRQLGNTEAGYNPVEPLESHARPSLIDWSAASTVTTLDFVATSIPNHPAPALSAAPDNSGKAVSEPNINRCSLTILRADQHEESTTEVSKRDIATCTQLSKSLSHLG